MKNMKKKELIGREIEVSDSKNKALIGIRGKIIDESKNMLTIRTDGMTKKMIKDQITFRIGDITIKGKEIMHRPEDRTKRK